MGDNKDKGTPSDSMDDKELKSLMISMIKKFERLDSLEERLSHRLRPARSS